MSKHTGCKVLGSALKSARGRLRWSSYAWPKVSAAEAAERLAISRAALTAYENGLRAIPEEVLRKIEETYGVKFEGVTFCTKVHHMGLFAIAAGDTVKAKSIHE